MIKNANIVGHNIPSSRYQVEDQPRGTPGFTVRSHVLAEVLRNANRWVRGYESPDSGAKEYGELYDCLVLQPQDYPKRFCMTLATYKNKDGVETKWRNDMRIAAVADWHAKNEGKTVVSQDDSGKAHGAIKRLCEDPVIAMLIEGCAKQVMITAEWHDARTGLVIPLKCLIDLVPKNTDPVFSNALFDLKTSRNASPRSFASDAQKYRYDLQGAFYLAMWNAATGEGRTDFGHVIQESYSPYEYRTPPPLMTQRFLAYGRVSYEAAMLTYAHGLQTGQWPSYDRPGAWPLTDCQDWFLAGDNLYPPMAEAERGDDEEVPNDEVPNDINP